MFERMNTEFAFSVQWNPHFAYDEALERLRELHAEALALELQQLPCRMGSPHYAARAMRELCTKFEERNAEVHAKLDAEEAKREKQLEEMQAYVRERFSKH